MLLNINFMIVKSIYLGVRIEWVFIWCIVEWWYINYPLIFFLCGLLSKWAPSFITIEMVLPILAFPNNVLFPNFISLVEFPPQMKPSPLFIFQCKAYSNLFNIFSPCSGNTLSQFQPFVMPYHCTLGIRPYT